MKNQNKIGIAVFLGGALVAGNAAAEEPELITEYGMSLTAGGGVAGFTDETMRDTADVGGAWDVRAALGTRSPIAIEAAYVGSAQSIQAIGLDNDAVLLGTGVEALARVNVLPDEDFTPYVFAGAGWKRYDLTNVDTNTSAVSDSDDLLEIPMGVGAAYRFSGFVADVRGEFRAATDADLIAQDTDEEIEMHTWGATAQVGYEF